jgi:Isochorismatase family
MADNLSIDRRTSALLVMDFQTLIVDNYAAGAEALLDRTAKLIAAARTAGIRVIYVVVGFRPGYPEVSDRNATFNGLKASGVLAAGAENTKIHPAVAPLAEEIVVTKHRVNAFAGTDLDLMLRANGIDGPPAENDSALRGSQGMRPGGINCSSITGLSFMRELIVGARFCEYAVTPIIELRESSNDRSWRIVLKKSANEPSGDGAKN